MWLFVIYSWRANLATPPGNYLWIIPLHHLQVPPSTSITSYMGGNLRVSLTPHPTIFFQLLSMENPSSNSGIRSRGGTATCKQILTHSGLVFCMNPFRSRLTATRALNGSLSHARPILLGMSNTPLRVRHIWELPVLHYYKIMAICTCPFCG